MITDNSAVATRWIGERIPRHEDVRLVAGQGQYIDDIEPVGVVHAAFVRSPHAHARVLNVDTAQALAAEGVVAVYTAADLGALDKPLPLTIPNPNLFEPRTQYPLAHEEVCYVGEIVAMVVAGDRYLAEDAAELVHVEYEVLPPVVGITAALQAKAVAHLGMQDNLAARLDQQNGDVDAAFAGAPHRLRRELWVERSAATPLEGRGVVAVYDRHRRHLTVHDSTQSPTTIRAGLSAIFGLAEYQVDVVAPEIGGGFGVKLPTFYPEEILVPFAALQLQRDVKWTEDRREHFIGSNHERAQRHNVEVAFDDEGRILGLIDRFVHDAGSYTPYGIIVPIVTAARMVGPYRLPAYRNEMTVVYTNTLPVTPYRGAGMPQGAFVMERIVDAIARQLGLDRADVRRRNFIQPEEFPYNAGVMDEDGTTMIYDSGNYPAGLDLALEKIGYDHFKRLQAEAAKSGRRIGIGLGCYVEGTGSGPYEGVRLHVEPTGKVFVTSGVSSSGQGHETIVAQVVAEHLGVDFDDVVVRTGDSRHFKWATGTFASRTAVVVGNAAAAAALKVREKAIALAADALEAAPEDLDIQHGNIFVKGAPSRQIPLRQIAILANPLRYAFSDEARAATQFVGAERGKPPSVEESQPGLEVVQYYAPKQATFASGAHAAIVEFDVKTATLKILRYVAVHDCGRVLNPAILEGQIFGGIAQGIGGAFYERMHYDDSGQLLSASFMDFLMPYVTEIPRIEIGHLETLSPLNPLGAKGAGEAGCIPVGAVLASAIEDALGVEISDVPLSPQRLFELMGGARATGSRQSE